MMFVLGMSASLTSCEWLFSEEDNPVTPAQTPAQSTTPESEEEPETTPYSDKTSPLTFEATVDGVKVVFKISGTKIEPKSVEYSLDDKTWTPLSSKEQAIQLTKAGDKVMFRGNNATYNGDGQFVITKSTSQARGTTRATNTTQLASLYGNITSMLKSSGFEKVDELVAKNAGAFMKMFMDAPVDAQSQDGKKTLLLPGIGTEPVPDAFKSLFEGSALQNAPAVVVQVLGEGTLVDMFKDCPNLESVSLSLGSLDEGVTAKDAMGGMLDGAGENAVDGLSIEWTPVASESSSQDEQTVITLDDVVNASDMSDEVLENASVTVTDPETGKTTETDKIVLVTAVKIDQHSLELTEKTTATLKATIEPEDATDQSIVWSSSDEDVVTVDEDGKVTAIAEGEAKIYAKHSEVKDSCIVKVTPADPGTVFVESVKLDKTELELITEDTATLTATVNPTNATDPTVTWTTSDSKVATVKNGVVTAVAVGTATITATAGDKSATCKVTVIDANSATIDVTYGEEDL